MESNKCPALHAARAHSVNGRGSLKLGRTGSVNWGGQLGNAAQRGCARDEAEQGAWQRRGKGQRRGRCAAGGLHTMPCHNNRLSFSLGFADIIHPPPSPSRLVSAAATEAATPASSALPTLATCSVMDACCSCRNWCRATRVVFLSFLPFAIVPLVLVARAAWKDSYTPPAGRPFQLKPQLKSYRIGKIDFAAPAHPVEQPSPPCLPPLAMGGATVPAPGQPLLRRQQ